MIEHYIGMRVEICRAVPDGLNQPAKEHAGKRGIISAYESVKLGRVRTTVPVITLDDGTVLRGYECWWSSPVGVTQDGRGK